MPKTVNTFTVALFFSLLYRLFLGKQYALILSTSGAETPDVSLLSSMTKFNYYFFNELRLTNATPAPAKTPIAPQSTIIKARRGLSRFTGSSGVRRKR